MTTRTKGAVVARAGAYEASLRMTKAGLGSLYFGTTEVLRFTATAFSPVVASPPLTDAALDLGTASLQYRDLYLSRNIINSGGYYQGSVGAALTAHAGGTQAAALALTKQLNFISTCATAGDSVRLPTSVAGRSVFVHNAGATAAQVYGASTDTINGIATATGVPLPVGRGAWFNCDAAGTWFSPDLVGGILGAQYNTDTSTIDFTVAGAKVAGAGINVLNLTGGLGAGKAITLPTAANFVAAIPNAYVGQKFYLRIANTSSGNFAWTVTTNTGLTLTGTMTIAQNTFREFVVTLTSLTAVAIQSLGTSVQNTI